MPERPSLDGCSLLLQRLDGGGGDDVLDALSERYEVTALDGDRPLFRVRVDDARFPDEAVVRLATVLDELDRDWGEHFAWPKATD